MPKQLRGFVKALVSQVFTLHKNYPFAVWTIFSGSIAVGFGIVTSYRQILHHNETLLTFPRDAQASPSEYQEESKPPLKYINRETALDRFNRSREGLGWDTIPLDILLNPVQIETSSE